MAADKLVDSGQLDGALTATATAIRTWTGTTATFPWNMTTGLQSSIQAIRTWIVPSNITFTSVTNNGTITTLTNAGAITTITNNSSKTIGTITNNGTINTLTNAGALTTLTNNSGKTITTITNAGTITTLENTGSVTVKSTNASNGTVVINAYNNASTPALESKTIVSSGKWNAITANSATTYWGRVTIPSGTPTFSGGSLTPTVEASFESLTCDETSQNGIEIQTTYNIVRADVTYSADANYWVNKSSGTVALATATVTNNGKKYYATSLNVPENTAFSIQTDAPDNSTVNTNAVLTIINEHHRIASLTNQENGRITITNQSIDTNNLITNSGYLKISGTNETSDNLYIDAYGIGGSLESNKQIIENGHWKTHDVTTAGTYYGKVIVPDVRIIQVTVPQYSSGGSGITTISSITGMTTDYYLINEHQITYNVSQWETGDGWIKVTYSGNYPSMILYFAKVVI